ncbi:hypothetical protein Aph01nite_17460 [Acrocarpospora phusangensis]|uniref:Methyltransferase n=1 Tax=Acrocarpospora phusangensis TaxID=1070424 RepID=A0A919Q8E5_9ACTN|nr:SAM-dependent methyltransferase [Acrocarpospora phusangensis]GIH23436.1 hypothetical protein Aph01nite_17460 [Acrocarpospora phusangensis]
MGNEWIPPGIDNTKPHSARMYDYVLGGKDNYAVDREHADRMIQIVPDFPRLARANRAFMHRVVTLMAESGIKQFIDFGTGIPTSPNAHEVAREVVPDARVVYVDNDPIVSVYSGALLAASDKVTNILADIRSIDQLLTDPNLTRLIDFDEPVGALFIAVLHLVPYDDAKHIVAACRDRMAPGSMLAISQPSSEGDPDVVAKVRAANARSPIFAEIRSGEEIRATFGDLELLDPGVVELSQWRPHMESPRTDLVVLGGVAGKSS